MDRLQYMNTNRRVSLPTLLSRANLNDWNAKDDGSSVPSSPLTVNTALENNNVFNLDSMQAPFSSAETIFTDISPQDMSPCTSPLNDVETILMEELNEGPDFALPAGYMAHNLDSTIQGAVSEDSSPKSSALPTVKAEKKTKAEKAAEKEKKALERKLKKEQLMKEKKEKKEQAMKAKQEQKKRVKNEEEEKEDVFSCKWGDCDKVFEDRQGLIDHCKEKHLSGDMKEFCCLWRTCVRKGFSFCKKSKLVNHFRCHSGEKPHVCPLEGCNKSFPRADSLRTHIETHSGFKKFTCPKEGCDRKYYHQRSLKKHLKDHPEISVSQRDNLVGDAINHFNLLKTVIPGNETEPVESTNAKDLAQSVKKEEQKRRLSVIVTKGEDIPEKVKSPREPRSKGASVARSQRRKSDASATPYSRRGSINRVAASIGALHRRTSSAITSDSYSPIDASPLVSHQSPSHLASENRSIHNQTSSASTSPSFSPEVLRMAELDSELAQMHNLQEYKMHNMNGSMASVKHGDIEMDNLFDGQNLMDLRGSYADVNCQLPIVPVMNDGFGVKDYSGDANFANMSLFNPSSPSQGHYANTTNDNIHNLNSPTLNDNTVNDNSESHFWMNYID